MDAGTPRPSQPPVCDPFTFPNPSSVSLFPVLPWTQAGLSVRTCHHPLVMSGGHLYQDHCLLLHV